MAMKKLSFFLFSSAFVAIDSRSATEQEKYSSYKEQREGRIFGSSHHESGSYSNTEEPSTVVDAFDEMGFFLPYKNLPEIPTTYSAYTEYNQPDPEETTEQYKVTEYYPPQTEYKQETYKEYQNQGRESLSQTEMFEKKTQMSSEMNGDDESSKEEKISKKIEKIDEKIKEIDEEVTKADVMRSEEKLSGTTSELFYCDSEYCKYVYCVQSLF